MLHNEIRTQLTTLGFKGMLQAYDEKNELSPNDSQWLDSFKQLLEAEITYRQTRSFMYRLNLARLPQIKTLETFKAESLNFDQNTLDQLSQCDFIKNNENILLIGGSGTGKTHIALALAHAALQQRYRIKFYRFSQLARELSQAQEHRYESAFMRRLQNFHLLIIDELGYLPVDQKAGALLFELFSALYENTPVIITTHLTFEEWGDMFGNKKSTKAMIDRLTHHCKILQTGNESWRLKEGSMNKK
jgi:DNA replication protein DnaC